MTKGHMRQMSQHRWSFEHDEAPMRADCPVCQHSVVMLQPRVTDVAAGRYVVEGVCQECGGTVRLSVP